MFGLRYQAGITTRLVRYAALGCFAFYVVWNAIWIARGSFPPSILMAFTGLPCPTTGVCRSAVALSRGDWRQSLLFNPLLTVYAILFAGSAMVLLRQALSKRRLALPSGLAWTWFAALTVGWVAKFAIGSKYW